MSEAKVNALLATILFAAFMLGAAVGWGGRGNEPHTAARCRANGHVEFIATGDHVLVRCAP